MSPRNWASRLLFLVLPVGLIGLCVHGTPGQTGKPAKSGGIAVPDCRILLINHVTLASDRNGVVSAQLPLEGDSVTAGSTIVELKDDVPKAALAVATKKSANDIEVRYAKKAAELAEAEFDRAERANRRLPGTVPEIEAKRLKLAFDKAVLQIEQAENELQVHRLERDQAAAELATYRIEAPFDGVVTRVTRSRGEAVRQGDPILELASTRKVKVEGEVELNQVWRLKPGLPVTIQLDIPDLPADIARQTFPGKLVFVDVTAQPVSGRVRVWAEVENEENVLRAGLPARMTIGAEAPK